MEICFKSKKPKRISVQETKAGIKLYCRFKELMLIIEVDGITHLDEKVIANDKVRQQRLENLGFTVLRFTDDEVLRHIEGVRMCLEDWIDDVEKKQPRVSTPFSSPASGG